MPMLIYGTARSSLQQACLKQVIGLTARQPEKRALLVVPEQTKMDVEKAYLALSPTPGLMMAEVLSFRRLAWRILGEVGRQPLRPIDQAGRAMLVHRVLRQNQKEMRHYAHIADKPGFVSQLTTVLGDLKRYRIGSEQLLQAAELAEDRILQEKSRDLACVLSGYDTLLSQAGLTDAEDDLTRLADVLEILVASPRDEWPWTRLAWLRQSYVWLSGFGETRDFTPQEDAVISGLAMLVENMTITVAADAIPADQNACGIGPDAYFAGRKTAWRLSRMLPGLRYEKVTAQQNDLADRIRNLLDNGSVEGFHQRKAGVSERGDEAFSLNLVQAASLDEELSWVAGEIRRLVQTKGYRYRDINLAVCNLTAVNMRLRAVFREYGIPLFLDMERPLSGTPLTRMVLSLLDIGLSGWSRPALMAYLRSGLNGLPLDAVDQLENAWLARGLFRLDRIFDDSYYQDRILPGADNRIRAETEKTGEEDTDSLHPSLAADCSLLLAWRDESLQPVRQILRDLGASQPVRDKVALLQRFLGEQLVSQRLEQRIGQLASSGEMDVAIALAQSWNALQHLLEQLLLLSADLPMSLRLFRDTLAAGMDTASSGVIPSAIDQVHVGNLQRASLRRSRVQFIVGATASDLPPAPPPEGLLKDPDRQTLSDLTGRQLPSSVRDKSYLDAYVLETLLTQPTDALYLTSPEQAVSRVFRTLATYRPACLNVLSPQPDLYDARLNAPVPAFRWLLQQPASALADENRKDALPMLRELLQSAGFRRPEWPARQTRITPEIVNELFDSPVVLSVSQLEQYTACPFSHLAGRLLALRRRPEWHPQLTETGVLLHGVLEQALSVVCRQLQFDPTNTRPDFLSGIWSRCLQTDWQQNIDAWLKAEAERSGLNRLFDAGLNASVARRIRRSAAASLTAIFHDLAKDPYIPVALEWVFGPENGRQLNLGLIHGLPVSLRGKVDRVDDRPHEGQNKTQHFRVIDYKSSQKSINYDAFYHGLALQLPLYLAAYASANPGSVPENAAWFTLNRPILNVKDHSKLQNGQLEEQLMKLQRPVGLNLQPEALQQLSVHAMKKARQQTHELLAGQFPVYPCRLPGQRPPCDYCDFAAFCRFDASHDPWHRPDKPVVPMQEGKRMTAREVFLLLLAKSCGEDP